MEPLPPKAVPTLPTVKYFHDQDRQTAEHVLAVIQPQYPHAVLSRQNLPAPEGRVEVLADDNALALELFAETTLRRSSHLCLVRTGEWLG